MRASIVLILLMACVFGAQCGISDMGLLPGEGNRPNLALVSKEDSSQEAEAMMAGGTRSVDHEKNHEKGKKKDFDFDKPQGSGRTTTQRSVHHSSGKKKHPKHKMHSKKPLPHDVAEENNMRVKRQDCCCC